MNKWNEHLLIAELKTITYLTYDTGQIKNKFGRSFFHKFFYFVNAPEYKIVIAGIRLYFHTDKETYVRLERFIELLPSRERTQFMLDINFYKEFYKEYTEVF